MRCIFQPAIFFNSAPLILDTRGRVDVNYEEIRDNCEHARGQRQRERMHILPIFFLSLGCDALGIMDARMSKVVGRLALVGSRTGKLQTMINGLEFRHLSITTRRSIRHVDRFCAISVFLVHLGLIMSTL